MTPLRFGIARRIGALVAAVSLLLTVALGQAAADALETITTEMEPGLSIVGWLGPTMPVAELFAGVPEIDVVHPRHAGRRAWQSVSPGVAGSNGAGLADFRLNARAISASIDDDEFQGITNRNGSLFMHVEPGGAYAASFDGEDRPGCTLLYSNRTATAGHSPLTPMQSLRTDQFDRRVRAPNGACGWRITGRAVNRDGDAIDGVIYAIAEDHSEFVSTIGDSGSFSIAGLPNGSWRLYVPIRSDCSMFYRVDGAVSRWEAASLVTVAGEHVTGIQVVLPDQACDRWITGRIVDATGSARSDVEVTVWTTRYSFYGWHPVEADGSFAVRVNEDGYYRIDVSLGSFCVLHYAAGEWATDDERKALWILARDRDASGVVVRLPNHACGWLINGIVSDSEQRRLPDVEIIAVGPEGTTRGTLSGADGSFSVIAPVAGSYQLRAESQKGCVFPLGAVETAETENGEASEELADARPITFDIELPADACARQIHGRLIDADGQGVADEWLWATMPELERGGAFTGPDGSFTITLPVLGEYALSSWISDECTVWYVEAGEASAQHATWIVVDDADIADLLFRLPDNPCG